MINHRSDTLSGALGISKNRLSFLQDTVIQLIGQFKENTTVSLNVEMLLKFQESDDFTTLEKAVVVEYLMRIALMSAKQALRKLIKDAACQSSAISAEITGHS